MARLGDGAAQHVDDDDGVTLIPRQLGEGLGDDDRAGGILVEVVAQRDLLVQGRGELTVSAQPLSAHLVQAGVHDDRYSHPCTGQA